MPTPEKIENILQTHASLVLAVVQTIHNPSFKPQLDQVLQQSAQNGWQTLVNVINKIVDGSRDQSLLEGLDEDPDVRNYRKGLDIVMPTQEHILYHWTPKSRK